MTDPHDPGPHPGAPELAPPAAVPSAPPAAVSSAPPAAVLSAPPAAGGLAATNDHDPGSVPGSVSGSVSGTPASGTEAVEAGLRRLPQQQRSKERVEAILDAARSLVVELGIEGVNTRNVCDRAGVPVASLYQYFGSIETVLLTLVDRDMQRMDAQVVADLSALEDMTFSSFVSTAIHAFLSIHMSSPAFVEIYLRGRGTPALKAYGRKHNNEIAHTMRELIVGSGLCRPDLPPVAGEICMEVGDRLLALAFEQSYTPDMAYVAEGITMIAAYLSVYSATPAGGATINR